MSGFTQIPNCLLDEMSGLTPAEFKALMAVYRLITGYEEYREKMSRRLSLSRLTEHTGLSRQGVINAMDVLEKRRYVSKKNSKGVNVWVVNSVDQIVHSVDQDSTVSVPKESTECTGDSQLSVPPSKKETSLNKPSKKTIKTKPARKPNPVYEIYEALLEIQRGINKGQTLSNVKKLIKAGYGKDEIVDCGRFIKSDPFFKEKLIPLTATMILQRIDEWAAVGKPKEFNYQKQNGSGRSRLTPAPDSERVEGLY